MDLAALAARRPKGMQWRQERQRWRRKGVCINEEGGRDSDDDQRGNGAGEASAWMMEGGKRGVGWVTDNADLCLRDHSDFFRAIDTAGGGDGRWCGASGGGIIIICARELGEVVHPVDCRSAKGCSFQYAPWMSCWN